MEDSRLWALLQVQQAMIFSLITSHPKPDELRAVFLKHVLAARKNAPETDGLISTFSEAFLDHFPPA